MLTQPTYFNGVQRLLCLTLFIPSDFSDQVRVDGIKVSHEIIQMVYQYVWPE